MNEETEKKTVKILCVLFTLAESIVHLFDNQQTCVDQRLDPSINRIDSMAHITGIAPNLCDVRS